MHEKLKSYLENDQLFYGFLIIIVGIASFGLGRLSATEASLPAAETVRFSTTAALETVSTASSSQSEAFSAGLPESGQAFVASKSGTKYHRLDCPGAKQIKPENVIGFTTAAAAKAAGYTPAANCPGL